MRPPQYGGIGQVVGLHPLHPRHAASPVWGKLPAVWFPPVQSSGRHPSAITVISLLVPGPSRCCGNLQVAVERIWASMNVAASLGAEMRFESVTASVAPPTMLGGGGSGGVEGGGPAAGNWVVAAPTNAGKTAIFIEITK